MLKEAMLPANPGFPSGVWSIWCWRSQQPDRVGMGYAEENGKNDHLAKGSPLSLQGWEHAFAGACGNWHCQTTDDGCKKKENPGSRMESFSKLTFQLYLFHRLSSYDVVTIKTTKFLKQLLYANHRAKCSLYPI